MRCPDGSERTETTGCFDVTNNTTDNRRRSLSLDKWMEFRIYLDDGHGFDNFSLVHFRARTVEISDNMGHASLISREGSEVDWIESVMLFKDNTWFLGVILWECLHSSTMTSCPFPGQEAQRSVTWSFEFSMTVRISWFLQRTYLIASKARFCQYQRNLRLVGEKAVTESKSESDRILSVHRNFDLFIRLTSANKEKLESPLSRRQINISIVITSWRKFPAFEASTNLKRSSKPTKGRTFRGRVSRA